jgi:hypothetical protein
MCAIGKNALILLVGLTCKTNAFQSPSFGSRTSFTLQAKIDDESLSFENAVRNGWKPERGEFIGIRRRTNTAREMSDDGAVMPDGGLSPCIIKVVGVGGGGCNAVSSVYFHIGSSTV